MDVKEVQGDNARVRETDNHRAEPETGDTDRLPMPGDFDIIHEYASVLPSDSILAVIRKESIGGITGAPVVAKLPSLHEEVGHHVPPQSNDCIPPRTSSFKAGKYKNIVKVSSSSSS